MKKISRLITASAAAAAAAAAAAILAGCNSSGQIAMSKIAPADSNAPAVSPARSSSGPVNDLDPIVYFDRVSVRDGQPETLLGLGFLRVGALTTQAFGLRFKAPGTFAAQPKVDAHAGIVYLKADDTGGERLLKLDPSTLEETELARLPQGIKNVAVSDTLKSMAWSDSQNEVYATFHGEKPVKLTLPAVPTGPLTFAPASTDLQISLGSSAIVFHGNADESETLVGYPIAREAGAGRLAAGTGNTESLGIQITGPGDGSQVSIPVEGHAILELSWSSDGRLAVLLARTDGSLALMSAAPETGQTALIAQLGQAASAPAERIVCPAWYGDSLYFGDATSSSFAIFRATLTEGHWAVVPFARAPSAGQGFVCPKLSQRSGGPS